jgi:hypothetical protein
VTVVAPPGDVFVGKAMAEDDVQIGVAVEVPGFENEEVRRELGSSNEFQAGAAVEIGNSSGGRGSEQRRSRAEEG